MPTRQAADIAVPLLDLTAQYAPLRDQVTAAIARVCDSQRFILGPEVEAFERELADALEVEHGIGVSSGTDAILAVLMALGIGPGDEVVTSTYSFFATAGCVTRLGATPVFVDIDPVTMNLDPAATKRALTPRTRAIVPVHLFGLAADMDALLAIGREASIPVVEDAAQAIGARYHGRVLGGLGVAGCFSFFPSKNLGAFGDGGFITTNDAALAAEIRLLRNHGAEPKYVHARVGGNFRLDALQAAILRVKAPHLPAWTDGRRRNADRYRALFDQLAIASALTLPVEPDGLTPRDPPFVSRVPRRDALRAHLTSRGFGTEIYYPVPFHRQTCFAGVAAADGGWPVADLTADTSLALPIFPELTGAQLEHVARSIAGFLELTG